MDAFYKESQPQSVKWENNMHCAVYVRDLKQWHRGQISRIVSETTAEVLLYDSGVEKTVDIDCLRELQEDMKRIETLAIECALADIRPTGGSTQWTATVCEYISYYLTGAKAKVIIQVCNPDLHYNTLPVKILWKDEAGRPIDFSEHLIAKGLAFRNTRFGYFFISFQTLPKKHPEVHLEQENPQLSSCNSEPAQASSSSDEQKDINVSKNEQKSKQPLEMDKTYKPPTIPEERDFQAVVSCVGNDGTLYIIPKSSEGELKKLMVEIQSNFRCLGLLEPYSWRKEEACVVRGSDSLWYRGKVVEHGGGILQVQYVDSGCIERVTQCHLCPTTLYTSIPPFCIPCQLYKTMPIGNSWQQDAVDLLQKLLRNEEVEIHVQVVYICLNPSENLTKQSATEGDASSFSELKSLDEALKWCNKYVDTLPLLTDFRTEMPCLVEYEDNLWYRAKLQSVEETDTVKILVQFVDYCRKTFFFLRCRLRQIPPHVLKYPVRAVHAMLAGFKPSLCDANVERIPYCPEWSVKALWAMMDSTEGKQLSASILVRNPSPG
uniref:RING finger protein 17 n=1 Tax=Pavo cristatus TaxID=9049 RepID=A0A8C9EYC8_PAVCR